MFITDIPIVLEKLQLLGICALNRKKRLLASACLSFRPH